MYRGRITTSEVSCHLPVYGSLFFFLSPHSGHRSHNRKVMETAKFVRRSAQRSGSLWSLDRGSSGDNESCESIAGSDTRSSLYLSENESQMSDGYGADTDSMYR